MGENEETKGYVTEEKEAEVSGREGEDESALEGKIMLQEEENKAKSGVNDVLIMNENNSKKGEELGVERKNGSKGEGDSEEEECVPPALPPRPPPRTRQIPTCNCMCDSTATDDGFQQGFRRMPSRSCWASGLRKYVFLCTACGSLSILLGTLFLTVYFMLKSYTSSLNHFETIPTYVPSGMLIATGFLIICLACRKNRNGFLMKLCGLCSLCCAVLCVSVTVTTTVIHMNRLQTLRECLYTQKTQSCTCYSVLMDNDRASDEGIKFVFNSTPDCEVVHGALYSCLRAIFGLSVIGILVCIFSCMLVYQLLSHEKKKMYWAQLEMRCRYLYRQQRNPHYCSCCDECRYPPPPHEIFPWDLMGNRFWSSGRIGNLYTPNPEDRDGNNRLRSAWNWRRLPWNRNGSSGNEPARGNLGSPDSQYGFSSTPTVDGAPYTVLDPRTTGCPTSVPPGTDITEGGFYSWGPPPPYASNRNSANNSPARRSLGEILHHVSPIRRNDNVSPVRPYHHVHHHHVHHPHTVSHQCTSSSRQVQQSNVPGQANCLQKSMPSRAVHVGDLLHQQRNGVDDNLRSNSLTSVHRFQKMDQNKDNYENTYDSEIFPSSNGFNTLPSLKKRNQTRASDLFQNETTSAYYFSSAENLGCAENNDGQFRNESLPPRIFLLNDTPRTNTPRYESSGYPKGSTEPEHQSEIATRMRVSPQGSNRTGENGNSFVKKLFVSCSPTKQKPEANFGEKNAQQVNKKKVGRRTPIKDADPANENVITFHYRLGIPRSPNIQNFGALKETSENSKEGGGSENGGEEAQEKVIRGIKYASKDAELLQKHGSLMKEFNKNVDLQRNLKFKSEKSPGRGSYVGVDNRGFQIMEEFTRPAYPSKSGEYRASKYGEEQGEDYPLPKNENESDVYFGDISNSSCYVSVQNEGTESSLYEEAVDHRGGQSLLSKQNLKRIEKENMEFPDRSETTTYNKLNDGDYQTGYRSRKQFRFSQENAEGKKEARAGPSQEAKAQRRQYLVSSTIDNKYFAGGGCYSDHYRPEHYQEASNDEHSSSSLTVDSGISTGRSYLPRCYDATYQEMENKENAESACFETLNERFSNMEKFQTNKMQNLDNIGDFSHSLFSKPKANPRGTRHKDSDPRNKKFYEKESACGGGKTASEAQQESEEGYSKQKDEGKSPKPLPRTSVSQGKYSQKEKHFLAPDAQYEYKTEFNQKPQTSKAESGKPVVPARPVNLQERCRNSGFGYCKSDGGCPTPRRRQPQTATHEETEVKDVTDIGSHSVNV